MDSTVRRTEKPQGKEMLDHIGEVVEETQNLFKSSSVPLAPKSQKYSILLTSRNAHTLQTMCLDLSASSENLPELLPGPP